MRISARADASTRLYMKEFHQSQRDPNPSRRVNPGLKKGYPARMVDPGWLLRSCKYSFCIDRRRVDPLRRVEANLGSCKGGLTDLKAILFLLKQLDQVSRPRGVMIGPHFHANIKVQTATCKDNNSKVEQLKSVQST